MIDGNQERPELPPETKQMLEESRSAMLEATKQFNETASRVVAEISGLLGGDSEKPLHRPPPPPPPKR